MDSPDVQQDIVFNIKVTDTKNINKELESIEKAMSKMTGYTHEATTVGVKMNKQTGKQEAMIRTKAVPTQQKLNYQMKRFKMEALGIMFGGMAIEKAFGKMTKAGMDLYQISDILNTTYGVMMIPVMDVLGEAVFGIVDYLMDLGDEEKMVIGTTMLLGQAFGAALSGLGQTILFISSLKSIGGLGGLFSELKEIFTSLGQFAGKAFTFTLGMAKDAKSIIIKGVTKIVTTAQALLVGDMTIKNVVDGTMGGLSNSFSTLINNKFARGLMVVSGGALMVNSIIHINDIDASDGLTETELLTVVQNSIGGGAGAGLITMGITKNGKAALAVTAVVAVNEIIAGAGISKDNILTQMINALAPLGVTIAAIAAVGGSVLAIPAVVVLSGVSLAANFWDSPILKTIGGIIAGAGLGIGAGASMGMLGGPLAAVALAIIGGIAGGFGINIGSAIGELFGFADGGIVTQPQMGLVGEAGPEAIIPLNKLNDYSGGSEIYAPEININAKINSEYDVAELAEDINRHLHLSYNRSRV